MKPSINLFWSFLKILARKWALWIFLALDAIGAIIQLVVPSFHLPQGIYVGVSIIGLIWASFETYLDLLSRIPSESRPITPEISMFLIEGSEYEYELDVRGGSFATPTLPKAQVTIHMRVENIGYVAVNLLTIEGKIDFKGPHDFMLPHPYNPNGDTFSFPTTLNSKESVLVDMAAPIYHTNLTEAQVAARTRGLIDNRQTANAKILIEAIDPNGKTYKYTLDAPISLVPLCQMYIKIWKEQNRYDLAKLALGDSFFGDEKND
jgi:hypothetical protein